MRAEALCDFVGCSPVAQVRKDLYMSSSERMPLYTESNYVALDTLFLLVDAHLFAQVRRSVGMSKTPWARSIA